MIDPNNKKELKEIIAKYLNGTASQEERHFIEAYFDYSLSKAKDVLNASNEELPEIKAIILERVNAEIANQEEPVTIQIPHRRMKWWWAAAAIFIGISIAGSFYLLNRKTEEPTDTSSNTLSSDVKAPSNNRAMITLSNGKTILLDSVSNGTLAMQGSIKIEKLADGKIAYNGNGQPKNELIFNTLYNPRGSKVIDITLADGTRVWLNAESSLKYPVAFLGNERNVEITGEAYFEVTHDVSKPFKVSKDNMIVKVLGTHFNVNSYADESEIKVTLLEGKVNVESSNQGSKTILPGEQAGIKKDGEITLHSGVDIDAVMAWKNGYFQFSGTSVEDLMRQIGRWYDVEIIYNGIVPEKQFGGQMERANNLSQVLAILEEYGLQFRIEGKKLIVMP